MDRKQTKLIRACISDAVAKSELFEGQLMAHTVKFGVDNYLPYKEVGIPLACNQLSSKLSFVRSLEVENCFNDENLLTIGMTCHHLVYLKISGNLITNKGIYYLAFSKSTLEDSVTGFLAKDKTFPDFKINNSN